MRSGSDPDVDPKYYHYIVPFLRPQGVWQLFDCCPPVRETKKFIKYLQARNLNWRFRPYSFGLEYQGQLSPSRQLYGALYEVTSCDSCPSTSLSADLKHTGSKHSFGHLVSGRRAEVFTWKKGVLPNRVILSTEARQLILTSCIAPSASQFPLSLSPKTSSPFHVNSWLNFFKEIGENLARPGLLGGGLGLEPQGACFPVLMLFFSHLASFIFFCDVARFWRDRPQSGDPFLISFSNYYTNRSKKKLQWIPWEFSQTWTNLTQQCSKWSQPLLTLMLCEGFNWSQPSYDMSSQLVMDLAVATYGRSVF